MFRFILAWLVYTWGGLHRYFGIKNNIRAEHEAAVRYFTRAYQIDPTFYQARLARAVLLWRELGRLNEALGDLNALIAADPTYGPALFNRAIVAQASGRYKAALADLEAYLALPDADYAGEAGRMAALLREILNDNAER